MTTTTQTKQTTALFYLEITVDGLEQHGKTFNSVPLFIFRTGKPEGRNGKELVSFWGELPEEGKAEVQGFLDELLTFEEAQKIAQAALEGRLFPGMEVKGLEYKKQDLRLEDVRFPLASMHFYLDLGADCCKYGFDFGEEETGFPFLAVFGPDDLNREKRWLDSEEIEVLEEYWKNWPAV